MKTTIEISDPLLRQAKRLAAREGTTLRDMVERGLRLVVHDEKPAPPFRLRRASFKGHGLREEMRGQTWAQLRRLAYEGHGG